MSYLSMLNNEMQTLMAVLLFIATIFITMALLCEMFSNHSLKISFATVCMALNIVLCIIWAFIFFNFKDCQICDVLAYCSAFVLAFEFAIVIKKKTFKLAFDAPFFIMLLPFWKYVNQTLSVAFIVVAIIYLFAKALVIFLNAYSKLTKNINYYSLKEALDGLKIAIMFENAYNVVYENLAMKNLLENLQINKNLTSYEIWQKLKLRECSKIIDNQNILVFFKEKVFSFSKINQSKIQIYAFDITKEYLTNVEIQNKQKELKLKQSKIIKMIENIDEIEKQKEVLALKSKLHDIIGQRLFILHHILDVIDEKNFDLNCVKNMLSSMIKEIDSDELMETKTMQNSIITAFEMIGFNIIINGKMPQDNQKSNALVKIIRECATNAIRHANATKLFVNISENKIEIFDNGTFKNHSIIDGTGIKGMRLNATELKGELSILTQNGFKVIINLKSQDN